MSGRDIAQHLNELSEKMDRYEAHRLELKKDVKAVSDFQKELVVLLAGSELNGKRGIVNFVDEIDKRTRALELENKMMQKDIETAKFWGRGTAGILFASILVIIKAISDKL
jgi:1-aminocyclopropane-1-carboxylate deaminase/D-cysteine desulfhydrase-like pyridoxal-dependent ACC family enzyme